MKNFITILGTIIIASFIMASCGQNSTKQKELELKEKEIKLREKELALDSAKAANMPNFSTVTNTKQQDNLKNNKISEQDNLKPEMKLSDEEYGEYSFDVPCGMRGYGLTLKFVNNTNKVYSSEGGIVALGEVGEGNSNGIYTLYKVDAKFKYIICKMEDGQSYRLKYSIKKKVWILLPDCTNASGEPVKEVEANK